MNKLLSLPTIMASLALAVSSPAQITIAEFGGDYVSSNQSSQASTQDLLGVPTASDSIRETGDFGVTLNPTIGGDYSGPSFNGGVQIVKFGVNASNGLANAEIVNDAGGDYLNLFSQSPSGTTGSNLNFLFSMDVNVDYGDITTFSGRSAGGVSGSVTSRFLIRDSGGNYYLSNTSISGGFGGATWSISNLATEQWAVFNPGADDWSGNFSSLTFDQTISTSTVIEEVGWFASRNAAAGFTNAALTIREFEVVAVPEPSAAWLALGAVLVVLAARRSCS